MSAYSQKRISPSGASVSPESGKQKAAIDNVAAKGVPFYTPEQDPPAGTAVKPRDGFSLPKLFSPLKFVALCYRIASGSVQCVSIVLTTGFTSLAHCALWGNGNEGSPFAHGYLVSSFLSPAINKRSDQYGSSFENRTRLATELVRETRKVLPEKTPLFVRFSATDWLEDNKEIGPGWTCDDSIRLAQMLAQEGVDVLDVSSGGNHPAQKVQGGPGYQAKFAKAIKQAVGDKMLVSTVWSIKSGTQAQEVITEGQEVDLVAAGRIFQKNPGLVWAWADDLGFNIQVAHQIGWGFGVRAAKKQEHVKLSIP
ncbi:hypothetical protein ACKAV7_008522 [Fusarium commune]